MLVLLVAFILVLVFLAAAALLALALFPKLSESLWILHELLIGCLFLFLDSEQGVLSHFGR